MKKAEHVVGELKFQMLFPPEGCSSILVVGDSRIDEFLHVSLRKDGDLVYEFFGNPSISVKEKQFKKINSMARKNLAWTDLSTIGLESFDEQ